MVRFGDYEVQTPAICASIISEDLNTMESYLEKALSRGVELVELRLDKLEDVSSWRKLLRKDAPTIVTNRSKGEGGYFEGSEDERIEPLLDAIDSGASCIDLEFSAPEEEREKTLEVAEDKSASVILSFHDFEGVPSIQKMVGKAKQMAEAGCDFAKLIGFANDPQAALRTLDFLIRASDEIEIPTIAFAMGEEGKFTRIAAPLLGSPITYASVGEEAAPGQPDVAAIKQALGKFKG